MLTPYDWQEGIGHRAAFVETKLAQGLPVIAVSLSDGVLMFTYRRHSRKLFEVYDKLMFGAIGQQSDVEALRLAAIEFAHQEGFNRSEEDVTIQRVVTALSASLKRAFGDFNTAPFVARGLFAEVGERQRDDLFYILDFDGDYAVRKQIAYCSGTQEQGAALKERLLQMKTKSLTAEQATKELMKAWTEATGLEPADLIAEAVLLRRRSPHERRFEVLMGEDADGSD